MAKNGMKLNQRDLRKLDKDISNAVSDSMAATFKYYKKETPIKSGNARNRTKYTERATTYKINSNYDYAGRLDSGWSKQSPEGMTDPSFKYLEKQINNRFKKI